MKQKRTGNRLSFLVMRSLGYSFSPGIAMALAISVLFSGCTGWNLVTWTYGSSPHPSPTPDYTSPGVILRGGLVVHRNTVPGGLGKHKGGQLLRGEACSWSALWLVSSGDASLHAAKKTAGIDYIHSVEYKQEATLGFFYHNFCTVVVGSKRADNPPKNQSREEIPDEE